jgi:HEAT repeat protein
MIQEQGFATLTRNHKDTVHYVHSRRRLHALLSAITGSLILTLLSAALFLIFASGTFAQRFAALLALLIHMPLLLLIPLGLLALCLLLALLITQPLLLQFYLRSVRTAQANYHRLYTPLTAVANIRRARDDTYLADPTSSPVFTLEERSTILDLVQQQNTHQMILGVPGAGKTMALRVYQYIASQQPWKLAFSRGLIPVYVPMKNYSLFLKRVLPHAPPDTTLAEQDATLLDFLISSDLPGMRYLRFELQRQAEKGRLLLLCDGLNEVDNNYLSLVSEELVRLMRKTGNRLVMTCREVDYREQPDFVALVNEGRAAKAVIYPLQPDQIHEFVERYVTKQEHWQHTAGQIIQVIDRSRFRYHCTNPMMLFTLMEIIDKIGVERGKQIDTRGRLLREWVKQLILHEQQQSKWNRGAPGEQEIIYFLSEVACAARWANDRNAIQLPISMSNGHTRINIDEWAYELKLWLDEHLAKGPFEEDDDAAPPQIYDNLESLLRFALSASLVEISPGGVLSFRHELIAEYFVAEYFFAATARKQALSLPIREELLENVGRWSEPVAIWAGLLDNPRLLAERFGTLGRSNPAYVLQALALALVCIGVHITPIQAEVHRSTDLPPSVAEALSIAVRNKAAREELARIFTRCAEEGGQEVYRSLLPLVMVEGVDELLTLLDHTIVPDLLFAHLQDAVDNIAYEAQVKRLTRILGRFGGVVVERSVQLSLPHVEHSARLRTAAINILGGTRDPRAVEPLIERLSDADQHIAGRATNALIRLGPALTLSRILQLLEDRRAHPYLLYVHAAALTILGRFLDEQDIERQLSSMQYQRVLETIVPILTSNYQNEPEIQQQAREILVQQAQNNGGAGVYREKVIEGLTRYLPSQDADAGRNVVLAFQEIGQIAIPHLLDQLNQPSEVARERIIEILQVVRDERALSPLLRLIANPHPSLQRLVSETLHIYAPESIPGLINLVLSSPHDAVAERAAHILANIGEAVGNPIVDVLFQVVPGRTRLLVQVLEQLHDSRVVPPLITLLQTARNEPLLTIVIIRALGKFPEQRVVPPLIRALSQSQTQIYEEAIDALGQLGLVALDDLIKALGTEETIVLVPRIQRAILIMKPFPGEQLIAALESCSAAQAKQITAIFKMQGSEAAQTLVSHLLHKNDRVRDYVYQALNEIPGPIVVPALLEGLHQPTLRKVITPILLRYPEAIPPLVHLLGEHERGETAAALLPQFGTPILTPLLAGMDDQRGAARERAQHILLALVQQSEDPQEIVREVVHLFYPSPSARVREALLAVLTNELAGVSGPALLEGLEDAHLIEDVSTALSRLAIQETHQQPVLDSLISALYLDERRRGAETSLVKIGSPAVSRVGELLTDPNQQVVKAAKNILRDMGPAALEFVWRTQSDKRHPARRQAALEVFHSMRAEDIGDKLVSLLISDRQDDVAMALTLLYERLYKDVSLSYPEREMVPELIDYIQKQGVESTNLRIIALFLLLGEDDIIDHLIQALDEYPQPRKQLIYLFLLLGAKAQRALLEVVQDPEMAAEQRAQAAAIVAMMTPSQVVAEYAQNISTYGIAATKTSALFPDELAIALRALGGLLAGGHWHMRKLQELRDASPEGSPSRELFNILLGFRYEPQIAHLQQELQNERDSRQKEIIALTGRIVTDQKRIQSLEEELEHIHREHGFRGDELNQVLQDKDQLQATLEQTEREIDTARSYLNQAVKERDAFYTDVTRLTREKEALDAQYQSLLADNESLREQNQQLIRLLNPPKQTR